MSREVEKYVPRSIAVVPVLPVSYTLTALTSPKLVHAGGSFMTKLIQTLFRCRLWKERKGQDLVEYALMAGFITVAVAAAFPPLESGINTIFSKIASILAQA